jgi:hypothetical protein
MSRSCPRPPNKLTVDPLTHGGGAARKKDLADLPTNLDKYFKVAAASSA